MARKLIQVASDIDDLSTNLKMANSLTYAFSLSFNGRSGELSAEQMEEAASALFNLYDRIRKDLHSLVEEIYEVNRELKSSTQGRLNHD